MDGAEAGRVLVAMTGLPGTGKTTLARAVGRALPAAVLSVDPIERAIRRAGVGDGEPVGLAAYAVAQALADDELALGHDVVADAVNVVDEARAAWEGLARKHRVPLAVIETRCADEAVHRHRVESRATAESAMPRMPWERVRELAARQRPWGAAFVLTVDSGDDLARNLRLALEHVAAVRVAG